MIEFVNCGDKSKVKSLYDCNLIGDYETIQSILKKCKSYGNMMANHIYKEGKTKTDENTWYCKYADLVGRSGCGALNNTNGKKDKDYDKLYMMHKLGEYQYAFIAPCYHYSNNSISNTILKVSKGGGGITDKDADCVYGTKEELENWKYYVFNNKLPLFINICLIIDQNNTSKSYIPWIVDKQYTDEELYNLLNINDKEKELINSVIAKYERNSKWFKRYMTGLQAEKLR